MHAINCHEVALTGRNGMITYVSAPHGNAGENYPPIPETHLVNALLAQAELAQDLLIAIDIILAQIAQQTAAAANHLEQAAAAAVILLMMLEMPIQLADAFRQQCDLHFGRTGITIAGAEFVDQFRLAFRVKHTTPP